MIEKINLLLQEIQNLTASSKEEVERLRIQYLSKKGILNDLFNDFKNVPNEEKRAVGQLLNELKNTAQEKINSLKETFENNDLGEQIDLSRSAADFNLGTRHPLSLVKNEIIDIQTNLTELLAKIEVTLDYPEEDLDNITLSGFAFDVGKVKLSDKLLWKNDKLTPEEIIQMQHHIHLGYDLIKNKRLPPIITTVMIMHHERCDGSGYPARLKEDRIHPYALLAGIADTYEAVTHPRAQRTAMTPFQAIGVFENQGLHKFGEKNARKILSHIAANYIDRRVVLDNGLGGRITEIHADQLSRPTLYCENRYLDLREHPEINIIRMN